MRHLLIANVALVREGFPRLHIRDSMDVSPHLLLRESDAQSEISRSTKHVWNTAPHFLQTLLYSSMVLQPTLKKQTETLCVAVQWEEQGKVTPPLRLALSLQIWLIELVTGDPAANGRSHLIWYKNRKVWTNLSVWIFTHGLVFECHEQWGRMVFTV